MFCDRSPAVEFAPMRRDDLELVLAWRSNPEIYRHFDEQDAPLAWEDHRRWFETRDEDRHDFVVSFGGRRVGVVSLGADSSVSVYLGDTSARGNGVATSAIKWLCERFADRTPLIAAVHSENTASKRLFERCGFERSDGQEEWIEYVYRS
jgi:RimJ/RimL family protein N-acetyltransferase